jgi:hypothetical protein
MLAYFGVVAVAAVTVLAVANSRPHIAFSAQEEAASTPGDQLTPAQAIGHFPAADVTAFATITKDTLDLVNRGDQAGARTRITDLEKAWDDAQSRLKPLDKTAWTFLDGEIDDVLNAVRAKRPDTTAEQSALRTLTTSLGA